VRGALVLLGLAAMLAGVLPAVAGANVGTSSTSTTSLPGALVWGNGVFTSRAEFGNWLHRRHRNLVTWSALHPRATSILVGAEAPAVRFRPSQFVPRRSPQPLLPGGTSDVGAPFAPIVPILVVLGLLLVVVSALPFPVFAPEWAPGAVVHHHRITLLIVGATVVGATAIAKLAG
jgi:hypothetical protein